MNLLVLSEDYSRPNGYVALHYVHSRNKWYLKRGINVTVISFRAKEDYVLDGIKVYTLQTYKEKLINRKYDVLVVHAPNIKHHYKFLKRYSKKFDNIVFFFHGHEVMKISSVYPKPFDYTKNSNYKTIIFKNIYDFIKLKLWSRYLIKIADKSNFVFVSNWMYKMFLKFLNIRPEQIKEKCKIIYNCIGEQFENSKYDINVSKDFDFLTIRNNLDGSKYGIDIVTKIARNNPEYKFCVVGKGEFFKYNTKPENLIWIDNHLTHEEIINYLNKSRCVLLPTRVDSQGVMACEIATFGIPLITSDIEVCKEIFSGFTNVGFINNDKEIIDIKQIFDKLTVNKNILVNKKYYAKNTIEKEIELIMSLKS